MTREVTFGLHRASFLELAARLAAAELARLGVAPAAALGVEALAARVSFEARATARWRTSRRSRGSPDSLARWPRRWRSCGSRGSARARSPRWMDAARDVAELARRFERQLDGSEVGGSRGSAGSRGARRRAGSARAARPDADAAARRVDRGRGGARARARRSCGLAAVLGTVPDGDDATLGGVPDLGARGRRDDPRRRGRRSLSRARALPLRRRSRRRQGTRSGDVVFFSAPGEGRETVEIARRILEEARSGDAVRPDGDAASRAGGLLDACSRRRSAARRHPRLLRARNARGPIPPGARSWRCSTARWRSSRRGASRSTSRSARCRRWTRRRRRRRPRRRLGGRRGRERSDAAAASRGAGTAGAAMPADAPDADWR